jgi:tetratricopeptide (TPR) repeat protein
LDDLSKAKEAFESSIKLDDRNPETYKYLGLVFLGEEDFEEAIPEFQRAIQLDFNITDAHFYLGNSLEALENYHRAIEEYKICIEQKPEIPEYLTAIGRTYYLNGNLDIAEENLKKSLEISKNLLDTFFYLGRIYESRKDFSSAIDYYYEAEKLNPDNIENLLRLGRLLILEDRVEESKVLLEHSTDISPESVSAHALLSIVYEDLEKYDKASDEHKTLNKLEPENYIHLKNLGYTERIRGKYDSAIEALTKATKLNDTDPEIYEMLGDLYRIKGSEAKKWKRYEDELKYYQKAYDYYNNFLILNPTPENLTFIKEFLDGFKRYKNLPLEERQRIEFHLWW